jgi:hypothetical protein
MVGAAAKEQQKKKKVTTTTESEKAKKLIANADKILAEVDGSHIFTTVAKPRDFPIFDSEEIECGLTLGTGAFSNVFEVSKIISLETNTNTTHTTCTTPKTAADDLNSNVEIAMVLGDCADEDHYQVDKAKDLMADQCLRNGSARYAVKRLRQDLNEIDRARGMIDLAIEIKFMSVICHPNIGTSRRVTFRWKHLILGCYMYIEALASRWYVGSPLISFAILFLSPHVARLLSLYQSK